MPLMISPESPLGRELRKWEKPYRYEEYPRMVYRANQLPNGQWSAGEGNPARLGGAEGAHEQFNQRCQLIVNSDVEHQRALEAGWRDTQAEAMEHHEAKAQKVAEIAAARHHEDQRLSPKALAEAKLVDKDAEEQHVPAITAEHVARAKDRARARAKKR